MQKYRVVIAEGRTLFRQGLAALLRTAPDFEITGEAANAEEARRACARLQPHLVLLDSALPGAGHPDGPKILPGIRACCPNSLTVVIGEADGRAEDDPAGRNAEAERCRALLQGAAAYLPATVDQTELLRVLRQVLSAPVETLPAAAYRHHQDGADWSGEQNGECRETVCRGVKCTEREKDIIALIAQGLCNKEISYRLGISTQTVKNHVSHLLEKLNLADRTQLAVYAIEHRFQL